MYTYSVSFPRYDEMLSAMFPEYGRQLTDNDHLIVDGERLMERVALIHQFEAGLFLRVIDVTQPVNVVPGCRLWKGPTVFQATNVDLEIRLGESPYEVVTDDEGLIGYLQECFAQTELEV
jgi:hypothetical protein